MPVKPIPDGYHAVTPYLIIQGAAKAIEFYKQALGATELFRMEAPGPGGLIGHAEIKIGDSPIMLADEYPDMGYRGPKHYGGTPVSILIYVPNADAVYQQALAAGATVLKPIQDQFYGDRSGTVIDPFGHVWTIATHTEDLTPEEVGRRAERAMSQMAGT
jgi:PhnB protein